MAKNKIVRKTLIAISIEYIYPNSRLEIQQACRTFMLGQLAALVRVSNQIDTQDKEERQRQREAFRETGKAFGIYWHDSYRAIGLI